MPRSRLLTRVVLPVAVLILVIAFPWSERIGPRQVQLLPESRMPVRATVPGLLEEVRVNTGEVVREGDVLGLLRDDAIRMKIQETSAALAVAEREVAAALARGDQAQAKIAEISVDELTQRLDLLNEELRRTRLVAPASGTVLTLRPEDRLGEWLGAGQTFVVLGRTDRLELEARVAQQDIERVERGQEVRVKIPAHPHYTFVGTVTEIAPAADSSVAGEPTVVVHAVLDNARALLRPGIEARAKIVGHRYPIGYLLARPFWRWIQMRFWR